MSLLVRIAVYVIVVFLVFVVYSGQHEETATGALQRASKSAGRFIAWSVVAVLGMEALQYLFID